MTYFCHKFINYSTCTALPKLRINTLGLFMQFILSAILPEHVDMFCSGVTSTNIFYFKKVNYFINKVTEVNVKLLSQKSCYFSKVLEVKVQSTVTCY